MPEAMRTHNIPLPKEIFDIWVIFPMEQSEDNSRITSELYDDNPQVRYNNL